MSTVLVLSGATGDGELAGSPQRPDYVIDGIASLLPDGGGSPTEGKSR
jgi:ribonucleotide monophosphatase NagD (HAD superfamily)